MESLTPDLAALSAVGVYAVVTALVFVESGLLIGFFLPGDTVLFAAGLIAGDADSGVSLPLLVGLVLVAAVTGDGVGYATGRRLGRPWLDKRVSKGRLDPEHLVKAERFFARWGWWSVVIARWIPWVRTFTPILAGTSRMPYPRFLAANVFGAVTWGAGLIVLGYLAAGNDRIRAIALIVAACFVTGSIVLAVLGRVRRR